MNSRPCASVERGIYTLEFASARVSYIFGFTPHSVSFANSGKGQSVTTKPIACKTLAVATALRGAADLEP